MRNIKMSSRKKENVLGRTKWSTLWRTFPVIIGYASGFVVFFHHILSIHAGSRLHVVSPFQGLPSVPSRPFCSCPMMVAYLLKAVLAQFLFRVLAWWCPFYLVSVKPWRWWTLWQSCTILPLIHRWFIGLLPKFWSWLASVYVFTISLSL